MGRGRVRPLARGRRAARGGPVGAVPAYSYPVLAPAPSYAALLHTAPSAPETPV